jgi:hypothetical protein
VSDPRPLSALQRMPRALIDVLAVAYDFLAPADLLRALTYLNITPRAARQYQIGDVSAELDELAQEGWVVEGARGYRCQPELCDGVLRELSRAQVSAIWGFVIRLTQSALHQRLGGASLRTLGGTLGLLARRDIAASLALEDEGGAVETLWAHYQSAGSQRAWLTERLLELDEGLLGRCPESLRAWVYAERACAWLWATPEVSAGEWGWVALKALEPLLARRGARALSAELQELYLSRASAQERDGRRVTPRGAQALTPEVTFLTTLAEALGAAALARGEPAEALALLQDLSVTEGGGEPSEGGGALRLLGVLSHLSAGDTVMGEVAWREGERALRGAQRRRVLLGGGAPLGRRLGALALCGLRDPQAPQALTFGQEGLIGRSVSTDDPPALRALDTLYEALNADPPSHTAALPLALEAWLTSPTAPLWDLLASTLAAWSGARLSAEQAAGVEGRAAAWEAQGFVGVAASLRGVLPGVAPTLLGQLREPEAVWHRPLRDLEALAAGLLGRLEVVRVWSAPGGGDV